MLGIIYSAINKIDGKVYIGKTKSGLEIRKIKHKSAAKANRINSYFYKAIRRYGWNNFQWEIIDSHQNSEVLNQLERLYISKYESNYSHSGYNLTEGGEGTSGYQCSKETREKISQNHGRGMLGKTHSKKTRKKISIGHQKGEFPGAYYKVKYLNPWCKVWGSRITYNNYETDLGYYNDPLSASIVYKLVLGEIR